MVYKIRQASDSEIFNWDECVLSNEKNPGMLQSKAYANTKSKFDWKPIYVVYEGKRKSIYAYFLQKSVIGFGYIWYLPSRSIELSDLPNVIAANKAYINKNKINVFIIKIDPYIVDSDEIKNVSSSIGLLKVQNIQPDSSTVKLKLPSDDLSDLSQCISRRANQNIRLAERQNLTVKKVAADAMTFKKMYEMMKTVNGGRGAAIIRPYAYYETFWTEFCMKGQGNFYFAYEGVNPVAGAFIVKYGDVAVYKDGGSTPNRNTHNNYSHQIQWSAIKDMNNAGVSEYDLCGVPHSSQIGDINHPYHGVGKFKTGFSSNIIDYCGTYDQTFSKKRYNLWVTSGDKVVKRIYWSLRHDVYF